MYVVSGLTAAATVTQSSVSCRIVFLILTFANVIVSAFLYERIKVQMGHVSSS